MTLLDLIGIKLKDDFLCDLFETYCVNVKYSYDRTHDNMADEYRCAIPELGYEFIFDDLQTFQTIFVTPKEITTWNPFEEDERIILFPSKQCARDHAKDRNIKIEENCVEHSGEILDWIRFDFPQYSIHYQFVESELKRYSISKARA